MLFLLYPSDIFSPPISLLKAVSLSFQIMPKLNKRIPLYKHNHPQCKCHCQTQKNRATRDVRKETHADNTEINTLLRQQSVAFLPEPPSSTQSSAMTSAQSWVCLCTSWPFSHGSRDRQSFWTAMAGHWSGTLRPWLGLQSQAAFCFPLLFLAGAQTTRL